MRLDPKYFIPFIIVVALFAALLIAYFTISSQEGLRRSFHERIMSQDSLRYEDMPVFNGADSLSVSDFKGKFVVLDFWSTWSNFSEDSHEQLADVVESFPGELQVLAAVVEDQNEKIDAYISRNNFPFEFVNGTLVFNKYGAPGLPTQLVYSPDGQIITVFFGYKDASQYDSLRTLIRHGE